MTIAATLARLGERTFPRFLAVGAVGFAVDLCAFLLARALLPDTLARLAALVVAVSATWWLNRRITFRSADPNLFAEWLRYCAASAAGAATNATVSLLLLTNLAQFSALFALGVGSIAALCVNFTGARLFAYKLTPSVPSISQPYSPTKVEGTSRMSAGGN